MEANSINIIRRKRERERERTILSVRREITYGYDGDVAKKLRNSNLSLDNLVPLHARTRARDILNS